jgi:hypothetical protein
VAAALTVARLTVVPLDVGHPRLLLSLSSFVLDLVGTSMARSADDNHLSSVVVGQRGGWNAQD